MQPVFSRNQRERPLQKSMFLAPTQPYSNRNNSVQYQYQGLLDMKRSGINIEKNKLNNFPLNNQSYQQTQQFSQPTNQILNFSQTPRHKQPMKIPHFSHVNPTTNSLPQINVKQLADKLQKVMGLVQNHDELLKNLNLSNLKQKQRQKNLIQSKQLNQIEARLKENVIPSLINQSTKEIYEHLFNTKFQLQTLKDQVENVNEKYKLEINSWIKQASFITSRNTSSSTLSSDRIQEPVAQLSSSIYTMQNKIFEIQKSIQHKDEYFKTFIQTQIQKNKKDSLSMKSSTIQSSLPSILIEYQELFIVKNPNTPPNKINLIKNRQERSPTEIILNSCMYQIDKQGYLLDGQNRYIVDQKGAQIKLDEKHIALLRQYNVFG